MRQMPALAALALLLAAPAARVDVDASGRWYHHQAFVFHDGRFAGTLSPTAMHARTDGRLDEVEAIDAAGIQARFPRYRPEDAACCPSRISRAVYRLGGKRGAPVVALARVTTVKNEN